MTAGHPQLGDTRIERTERNNGTELFLPQVCKRDYFCPLGQLYWTTIVLHPFDYSMQEYGTLEYAKKAIDLYLKRQEEAKKWQTKSVRYITYP